MSEKMTPQTKHLLENYADIRYKDRKEIVQAFKDKCKAEGVSQAEILRKAVHDFLNNPYFG